MLEFAVELCEMQMKAGRAFIFEHPATATSWELGGLKRLFTTEGVHEGLFDMCRFGMESEDKIGVGLVRKTTRIVTNAEEIAGSLCARFEGGIGMCSFSAAVPRQRLSTHRPCAGR